MIQLQSDCLVFKTSSGECIPCSAEQVTIELIGDAAAHVDPDVIQNASAAVLHYFKMELKRYAVSVGEFSDVLVSVLRSFGLQVVQCTDDDEQRPDSVNDFDVEDLRQLACKAGKGYELLFFNVLRHSLVGKLQEKDPNMRYTELKGCVKQLLGKRRWSPRCEELNDQIVDFLRNCLRHHAKGGRILLDVRS